MKQHPVPQHIASYHFRLIGEMTLKQFLELAGGLVIAWLIYSLKIPSFIKWPFVLIAGIGGAALAFLPVEERSLDKWVVSFLRSIYSPTQFLYKKENQAPSIFTMPTKNMVKSSYQKKAARPTKTQISEYLESFPQIKKLNKIEKQEKSRLNQIFQLLDEEQEEEEKYNIKPDTAESATESVLKSRTRKLRPESQINIPKTDEIKIEKKETSVSGRTATQADINKDVKPAGKPQVKAAPPLSPPILVESSYAHNLDPAIAAQFSTTLPIPQTPEVPNLIVGMVLNDISKIVPGALIEIINEKGETARALKSNKLGQFFSASPLKNGKYQIKVEHPKFVFDIIELKAKGKIILPLKIIAKSRKNLD
jgi:hypothetical protein